MSICCVLIVLFTWIKTIDLTIDCTLDEPRLDHNELSMNIRGSRDR